MQITKRHGLAIGMAAAAASLLTLGAALAQQRSDAPPAAPPAPPSPAEQAVRAGAAKIAFPADYAKGALYTTLDRADLKQFRELYASPNAIEALRKGEAIPSGTVLTLVQFKAQLDAQGAPLKDAAGRFLKGDLAGFAVMVKQAGSGAAYPEEVRNGDWSYQGFTADAKPNEKANIKGCFDCHKPHAEKDYVFSLAALKAAAK